MKLKNLTVAVLMGGTSTERAVSLKSGAAVANALRASGATVREIVLKSEKFWLPDDVDVVFVALHGTFGEDGTLQKILEERGVPFTGSDAAASARAFDKIAAKNVFAKAKIPTPPWEVLTKTNCRLRKIRMPFVVKPVAQGSSFGISIVCEAEEFGTAIIKAFEFDERVMVEKFIEGIELTVGILGENPLPIVQIVPRSEFFDYRAKYTKGETEYWVPAPLSKKEADAVQDVALRAHRALGCRDLSRVDVMLDASGAPFVLEVNTIPGFTETSLLPKAAAAAGISFENLCATLVEMTLARHGRLSRRAAHVGNIVHAAIGGQAR
jgi:D-alanine-D-alanine ligase